MSVHEVNWEVTNRCNLNCVHCIQCSAEPHDSELSTREARQVISRFVAAGVKRICWTGGEPFARQDFRELLEYADAAGIASAIITNGVLLTEDMIDFLVAHEVPLGISLDGASAETHNAVRGDGSFEQVLRVIKLSRQYKIPLTVYCTVTRRNIDELWDIVRLAQSHGCGVHINEVSLGGRAEAIWPRIALSGSQREQIVTTVTEIAEQYYGETLEYAPDGCWADGTSLYLRSDGQMFLCSEQAQHTVARSFGHVLEQPLSEILTAASFEHCVGISCCYRVLASEHVTLIINQSLACPLVPRAAFVLTLDELNQELDKLYLPFASDCAKCNDKCCQGYVWLMPEEVSRLYGCDVSIIEVNGGVSYINSFPEEVDGSINVSTPSPLCSQLCSLQPRRCRIYTDRPFSCRLYPVGFEVRDDGMLVWGIHRDCQIVRRLEQIGLFEEFQQRILRILDRIGAELYASIIDTYKQVYVLEKFPYGGNVYCSLKEVMKLE